MAAGSKTTYSKRPIALSQTVLAALREHRLRQVEERLVAGPAWEESRNLVFCNQLGQQFHPLAISDRDFERMLKKARLPLGMRFHDLRHTAATLLLARGVNPKIVSEMLGHSDVATTLRIYAHVTPRMQQLAADVMDLILRRQA